jgi:hypothetical protein
MRAWLKAVREKDGMEWAPADQPGWDFYPEEEGGEVVPGKREHAPLGYSGSVQDQPRVFLIGVAVAVRLNWGGLNGRSEGSRG